MQPGAPSMRRLCRMGGIPRTLICVPHPCGFFAFAASLRYHEPPPASHQRKVQLHCENRHFNCPSLVPPHRSGPQASSSSSAPRARDSPTPRSGPVWHPTQIRCSLPAAPEPPAFLPHHRARLVHQRKPDRLVSRHAYKKRSVRLHRRRARRHRPSVLVQHFHAHRRRRRLQVPLARQPRVQRQQVGIAPRVQRRRMPVRLRPRAPPPPAPPDPCRSPPAEAPSAAAPGFHIFSA